MLVFASHFEYCKLLGTSRHFLGTVNSVLRHCLRLYVKWNDAIVGRKVNVDCS